MNCDFSKIRGPKLSAQENFELLICQLLAREINAISINGKGGDDGIDCFIVNELGNLEIFQMKYFIPSLTSSQKNQIKQSFRNARLQKRLSKWILCIPHDHTPAEKHWFDSIDFSDIKAEWWGETKLRNLLAKHPEIGMQFFIEDEIIRKLDDLKTEITGLSIKRESNNKRPNTLPRAIPNFIGRKEQILELRKAIEDNFHSPTPAVVISSIDGMPGVGKTALAVHLAHTLTPEFPDAQLYIDCYGYTEGQEPLTSEQILDSLLFALGVPIHSIPKNVSEKSAIWKSELAGKRAIILIDNVKTQKQVEPILPGTPGKLVLVTSRNRLTGLVGSYPLQLDVLNEEDSIELIQKVRGHVPHKEAFGLLSDIVRQCGYLPLALNIVAGRWRRHSRDIINNEIELHKRSAKLAGLQSSHFALVNEVFELSYGSLSQNEQKMFQMMGVYPGLNFTVGACAAMLCLPIETAQELVEYLVEESLVVETSLERYRLHDLLREFSRNKYRATGDNDGENKAILQLIDYYLHLLRNANNILYPNQFRVKIELGDDINNREDHPSIELALAWFEDEIDNLFAILQFAFKRKWDIKYWQLSQMMAGYLKRSISSFRVIEIHSNAFNFSETSNDLEMKASSLTELAFAYHESGNFNKAIELFEKAEVIWGGISNDDGLAYTLNGHGFTLERLGLYEDALNILTKAIAVHEFCENEYGQAFTLNNTGAVYWRMEKYEIALSFFEKALKIREKLEDWVGIGSTTNNMAFSHLRLGNIENASSGFFKSLHLFRTYHDRHGEAVVLNNLGYLEIEFENYRLAINYSRDARDVAAKIGDDYQIGRSYDVEGKSLLELGDVQQSMDSFQEALKIFERLNVPEVSDVRKLLIILKKT
ncbi:hypothetical protein CJD36_004355 [Flavipsychrobacter stenotrophus]|uniref:NB-ARC domain-containing protein n=1 Tax=Flavipsychrobacter stenotrophus TaxID=2077091 RepID=A0A2S7T197_9BACT|nr:tetratricopeptide repeat protein [Flavipsychrobacter stenotrophus]PQJ12982.1 hypothetical protein CJD36_004355 [Flavipsychrobacter stenotrophus]